jgi:hypothetical protein
MNPLRRHVIFRKLLAVLVSLVVTLGGLELVSRMAVPVPAPVLLREGIYLNPLPLVNGRPVDRGAIPREGERLGREATPGEVRVFVFGESSVEGSPWGTVASPPSMLRDLLARALPGRTVTVVNMGRVSAFAMDTYYHLLSIRGFGPDYIIFYTGTNNRFDAEAEMCLPLTHPTVYGTWRFMVENSHLLWTVRALLPDKLERKEPAAQSFKPGTNRCEARLAERAWADILVGTARDTGARVIVTSPVRSGLAVLEGGFFAKRDLLPAEYLASLSREYREVLACRLSPGCDYTERFDAAETPRWLAPVVDAWREAAVANQALFLDFNSLLARTSPGRVLGPPMVVDDVHLSVEGYWLLAELWARAIAGDISDKGDPPAGLSSTGDVVPYERALGSYERILMERGLVFMKTGMLQYALSFLQPAAERFDNRTARLALGWLRAFVGLPHGLPPELSARLHGFDPSMALDELDADRNERQ